MPVIIQKDKRVQLLEEENAKLTQTLEELKKQISMSHSPPGISPDTNNATRKLQDEINTLTKRNCGEYLHHKNDFLHFIIFIIFLFYLLF